MFNLGLVTLSDLRNIYNLNLVIHISDNGWTPHIQFINKPNQSLGCGEHFDTYEKAFDNGLKECIRIINEGRNT